MTRGPANLYPDDRIADAIERKRIDLGLSTDEAARLSGMGTRWNWYKKVDGKSPFTLEQIGLFAAAVGAPAGWPFVEWSAAKWLESELDRKNQ